MAFRRHEKRTKKKLTNWSGGCTFDKGNPNSSLTESRAKLIAFLLGIPVANDLQAVLSGKPVVRPKPQIAARLIYVAHDTSPENTPGSRVSFAACRVTRSIS